MFKAFDGGQELQQGHGRLHTLSYRHDHRLVSRADATASGSTQGPHSVTVTVVQIAGEAGVVAAVAATAGTGIPGALIVVNEATLVGLLEVVGVRVTELAAASPATLLVETRLEGASGLRGFFRFVQGQRISGNGAGNR